jgi:hypothetical protein
MSGTTYRFFLFRSLATASPVEFEILTSTTVAELVSQWPTTVKAKRTLVAVATYDFWIANVFA